MLCILYVNAAGLCLGLAGLLVDRALPAAAPRRWLWCLVILVSMVVPGTYRFHHSWTVAVLGQEAADAPMGSAVPVVSAAFSPGLWARVESYETGIGWLSLLASAFVVCWGLVNATRIAYAMTGARRRRSNDGQPIVIDGVPVVVTDSLGPATIGLWRSRVVVPQWVMAMPETQRRYVVGHEDAHRSAYDAPLLFIASLLLILGPWNLALWWQLRRLYLAVEIDCDNRVVRRLGNPDAYGELLLKVAQAASRGPRMQPALLGGIGSLEQRLTALLDPTPLRKAQKFLLPALALGLLFVVLITPHPVMKLASHVHSPTAPATITQSHARR